jgi:hypothetical protein
VVFGGILRDQAAKASSEGKQLSAGRAAQVLLDLVQSGAVNRSDRLTPLRRIRDAGGIVAHQFALDEWETGIQQLSP